jgi:hypothetical protein
VENVAASGEFWLVRPASEGTGVGVAVGVDGAGGWETHPAKSTNPAIVTTHRRAWSLFDIGVHTAFTYLKRALFPAIGNGRIGWISEICSLLKIFKMQVSTDRKR